MGYLSMLLEHVFGEIPVEQEETFADRSQRPEALVADLYIVDYLIGFQTRDAE